MGRKFAVITAVLIVSVLSSAYSMSVDEELELLKNITPDQVDEGMRIMAQRAAENLPMQIDSQTVMFAAMYTKFNKTLSYQARASVDLGQEQKEFLVENAKAMFCNSKINRFWVSKGVTFRYMLHMPSGRFDYSYDRNSCR